ncbi:hypothetical protein [Sphingobacterium yanglingense]|uniref:Uncharacterized protein n=1 Tax=Sphingobacterium yanglingense TaxID=1437280 RepID=A0A4R6WHS8_9SPHI|nr:hypothetical protein [Sphingobacterium yanglingense]TDQ77957.1 hypothetical protein CLV99_1930 [Sphingobacterium yanglingense]
MKNLLLLLSCIILQSFTAGINDPIDRIGVKGPLTFDKTVFNLAWSSTPNKGYYVQEYLPKGEKVESFNQMLSIQLLEADISINDVVSQKLRELNERKKTDPICNYQVIENPEANEVIVDFLIGESKNDKMTIVEFNVYRYKQLELPEGKKAIILYFYSKRSYGERITPFLQTLKTERTKYINEMIGTDIPKLSIKEK